MDGWFAWPYLSNKQTLLMLFGKSPPLAHSLIRSLISLTIEPNAKQEQNYINILRKTQVEVLQEGEKRHLNGNKSQRF